MIISRKPQSHHHSALEYESLKKHIQDLTETRKRLCCEIILGRKPNGGVSFAGRFEYFSELCPAQLYKKARFHPQVSTEAACLRDLLLQSTWSWMLLVYIILAGWIKKTLSLSSLGRGALNFGLEPTQLQSIMLEFSEVLRCHLIRGVSVHQISTGQDKSNMGQSHSQLLSVDSTRPLHLFELSSFCTHNIVIVL